MKNGDIFIEKLYIEKYTALCRYISRMISSPELVEDMAQETFVEAYRKREVLMEHDSPVGWLYLTAKNKIMNANEKQRRYAPMEELEGGEIEVDGDYGKIDLENSLENTLTKEEIEIFHTFYNYGYSTKEMANKLEVSENCFRTRLFRIREKLRDVL